MALNNETHRCISFKKINVENGKKIYCYFIYNLMFFLKSYPIIGLVLKIKKIVVILEKMYILRILSVAGNEYLSSFGEVFYFALQSFL